MTTPKLSESELNGKTYAEIQQVYEVVFGKKAPVATSKVNLVSAILAKQEEGSTPNEEGDQTPPNGDQSGSGDDSNDEGDTPPLPPVKKKAKKISAKRDPKKKYLATTNIVVDGGVYVNAGEEIPEDLSDENFAELVEKELIK